MSRPLHSHSEINSLNKKRLIRYDVEEKLPCISPKL